MSRLSENYKAVTEGRIAKSEFVRQARQMYPQHINQFTTFDDSIKILRKRGLLSEEVVYQCLGDKFPLEAIERGIDYELEEMGYCPKTINSPVPGDYRKAKQRAIDNLVKDPLHYINKVAKTVNSKDGDDQMKQVTLSEGVAQAQEDFKAAEKLFVALLTHPKFRLTDPTTILAKVRTKFPRYFPSKDCVRNMNLVVLDRTKGQLSKKFAQKPTVRGKGGTLHEGYEKEKQLLKEAIKQTIVRVLDEAATTNLAQISDENASIQNIPALLNTLENIVTEIESFVIKTQTKVQGVFTSIGELKNEDGLPIGYQFAQPILDAFTKDLEPVLAKISLEQIALPPVPEIPAVQKDQPEGEEQVDFEDKETIFTPNKVVGQNKPLQEEVKVKK